MHIQVGQISVGPTGENPWVLREPVLRYPDQLWTALQRAHHGDPDSQFQVGYLYWSNRGRHLRIPGDKAIAIAWLEKAAAQGHAKAAYYLGLSHEYGLGRPKDPAKARQYFEFAAKAGEAWAQSSFAHLLTLEAPTEALHWTRLAAQQGHVPSYSTLAFTKVLPIDPGERAFWLKRAADAGHPVARQVLELSAYPNSES